MKDPSDVEMYLGRGKNGVKRCHIIGKRDGLSESLTKCSTSED